MEGLIKYQEDWYDNLTNYNSIFKSKQDRIDAARGVADELGLGEGVVWEDNKANKMLTYTTKTGETGQLTYDELARMEAAKEGKAGAD